MPRIVLFTGKGGVGKTTVAAATALQAARRGHRTIVLSTDPAHSLGDVFDRPLEPEPIRLGEKLDGQEIDIYYSVAQYWGKLQEYLRTLFQWRGVNEVFAEEMSVLPGMEEVAGFLWVRQHVFSGNYDLVVIDAAPTGETLRFLSLPDVGRWWMEKLFPIHRRFARVLRPAVTRVSDLPVPQEETYDAAEGLFRQLDEIHALFTDAETTSVRLVLNPESVVVQESQRAYTYLNLFGYAIDAVVLNRMLPAEAETGYFANMRRAQLLQREAIRQSFAPLPLMEVPFFPHEVIGREQLGAMGAALYGDRDPRARLCQERPFEIRVQEDGSVELVLVLPFARKEQIDLAHHANEIVITVGNFRRNFHLPRVLYGRSILKARMQGNRLHVRFGPRAAGSAAPAP